MRSKTAGGPVGRSEGGLTPERLYAESVRHRGRGGTSAEAGPRGLTPAFLNRDSGEVCCSCFSCGAPAPVHLLDGLPEDWVSGRGPDGRVTALKPSVVAGFVRDGRFYTREQACVLR